MKHTVDLKKYQIRTDLVIETIDEQLKNNVDYFNDIKITEIILDEQNGLLLNKKEGIYITIEFKDITDSENQKNVTTVFSKQLSKIMEQTNIKQNDTCLIVALGNELSTPDSLGPLALKNIIITNHIFMYDDLDSDYRRVLAIKPGVTGQTGIETSDYIKAIVNDIKPDFIIIIDALASKSIERINKTIQLTNTGISPGSGIGNNRKKIDFETLNIPVIAVGIPTVVDAVTIVSDTINLMHKNYAFNKKLIKNPINKLISFKNINYLKQNIDINNEDKEYLLGLIGKLSDNEIRELINEVLTPVGYNLMITPKEIDFVIEKLGSIISDGINNSLHKKKIN
ncbi:MAG: GPR endopeptidase [Bacilli bacterium]|nr:GPR endopeptidase [Bacilli bacterium]